MKTILILEDEKALMDALSTQLTKRGYNILKAGDGEEGLQVLADNQVDMVLLDIIMPKVDGVSFLQQVHQNEKLKETPIIVLSNLSSGEKVMEAKEQGVTDYLIKTDWTIEDIIRKIESHFTQA